MPRFGGGKTEITLLPVRALGLSRSGVQVGDTIFAYGLGCDKCTNCLECPFPDCEYDWKLPAVWRGEKKANDML